MSAAIVHIESSLRLNPASPEAHDNLGAALLNLPGRTRDAAGHFETAIQLNPRFTEAHFALAAALDALPDRRREARAHAGPPCNWILVLLRRRNAFFERRTPPSAKSFHEEADATTGLFRVFAPRSERRAGGIPRLQAAR